MPSYFDGLEPFAWQDSQGVWYYDEYLNQKAREQGPYAQGERVCRDTFLSGTWFYVIGEPDIRLWVPDGTDRPRVLFG